MTPTARSLEVLRELGYVAQVVEQTIPHTQIKRDLLGVIDIVAVHHEYGILGVQATSGSNHARRVQKALAEPRLGIWLLAGAHFQVWSWRKAGKAGERKRWALRREPVTTADFPAPAFHVEPPKGDS